MNLPRWITNRIRAREAARWLPTAAGCCTCGTGGPYYEGTDPQVTRYVYDGMVMAGARAGDECVVGWSSCSRHPLEGVIPAVDYGRDVVVTFAQQEADFAIALGQKVAQ
jgi:hypothetical protein